jgi:hypothetical protein
MTVTPYIQTWSVQSHDPAAYFGKEITGVSYGEWRTQWAEKYRD